MSVVSKSPFTMLQEVITKGYDLNGLDRLCAANFRDYQIKSIDNLEGRSLQDKAHDLVKKAEQSGWLSVLENTLENERPHLFGSRQVQWQRLSKFKIAVAAMTRDVAEVIAAQTPRDGLLELLVEQCGQEIEDFPKWYGDTPEEWKPFGKNERFSSWLEKWCGVEIAGQVQKGLLNRDLERNKDIVRELRTSGSVLIVDELSLFCNKIARTVDHLTGSPNIAVVLVTPWHADDLSLTKRFPIEISHLADTTIQEGTYSCQTPYTAQVSSERELKYWFEFGLRQILEVIETRRLTPLFGESTSSSIFQHKGN